MGLRIVLMGDGPQFSTGYSVIIKNLAREFTKRGLEVAFMSLQTQGAPLAWRDPKDGTVYPVYSGTEVPVGMAKGFRDFAPDLAVHVRDAFYGSAKHHSPAYRVMGVPHRPRTVILMTPVQNDLLPDEFLQVCREDAHFVVTMTEWSKEVLRFQGLPAEKVDFAYGGYDPDVYKPGPARKEDYGFSPDRKLISFVGLSSQPRKSIPTLIRAASMVRQRGHDVELYLHTALAGMSADIPHFTEKYGMKGSVILPSESSNWGVDDATMAGIYNASDVYCTPSAEEGFDMPMLEAFACGATTAATAHPNHKEVLGRWGYYAGPKRVAPTPWSWGWNADPEDLAKAIEAALDGAGEMREGQLEYVKKFTWEKVADRWMEIFRAHGKEWGLTLP